jgi:hypothetical protein
VTTLIIGNSRTEEMVGDLAAFTPLERQWGGCSALRLLWFAQPGDVVVLPYPPRREYLEYLTTLTGTDPESLVVLCPPPGVFGTDLLTPDRTADPGFREQLRAAVKDRGVDRVLAVFKDVPVTRLAAAVGLTVPGHAFSAQGGDAFINSKAVFRAVAAGAGAPIVEGLATTQLTEARDMVAELLAAGHSAIVKREFSAGGAGNEILSPVAGVRAAGALTAVVLADATAVTDYFARRWDWLTAGGQHRLVVERYLADCDTVYGEYLIDEDGAELSGIGEILMEPGPIGEIVPAQALNPAGQAALVDAGMRVCRVLHLMGYRGYLSTDAVLTPGGEIFLTETNGRMSGSTHLHVVIHRRLLDTVHRGRRVALELHDWPVPSFAAAAERLSAAGLAFDRSTGSGVVLTSDLMPDGTLTYCVVAEDIDSARAVQREIAALAGAGEPVPGSAPQSTELENVR